MSPAPTPSVVANAARGETVAARVRTIAWLGGTLSFAMVAVVLLARRMADDVGGDLTLLDIFEHLFVRYDAATVPWFGVCIVLGAFASRILRAEFFDGVARACVVHPWRFAGLAFVAIAACSRAFSDYPLSLDEYAQVFQAEIFASGNLQGHYPAEYVARLLPLPGQFVQFSPRTGATMSGYWPGLPLLLAPFARLGIVWAANPLVGAAALLLLRRLLLRLVPGEPLVAGWAMLLLLASPAFFVNAMSYYTTNTLLALGLAYVLLVLDPTPGRLVLAGLLGAFAAVQHNPVPHMAFAMPWIVSLLRGEGGLRRIVWLGLGYLPVVLVVGGGWYFLKSSLAVDWLAVYAPPARPDPGADSQTWRAWLMMIPSAAWTLDTLPVLYLRFLGTLKTILWSVPGLVVTAFFGYRVLRHLPAARLLAWSAGVTFGTYLFVPFDQGHGWAYRYFHGAWPVLPLFGAAWVVLSVEGRRWTPLIGAWTLASLFVLTPVRVAQVGEFVAEAKGMAPAHDPSRRQLVFVRRALGEGRYYSWDRVRNDPFLRNRTWLMESRTPDEDAAFARRLSSHARIIHESSYGTVWALDAETL